MTEIVGYPVKYVKKLEAENSTFRSRLRNIQRRCGDWYQGVGEITNPSGIIHASWMDCNDVLDKLDKDELHCTKCGATHPGRHEPECFDGQAQD